MSLAFPRIRMLANEYAVGYMRRAAVVGPGRLGRVHDVYEH